jgi:Phage P22-like portal protein
MAKKAEKIAHEARLACEKFREGFKWNIDQYHEMHTFVLGQQWTDEEEDDMIKTFRKVPMVANKLGAMANSLLGEQQQNTPQLQVVPMSNCDERTAHLRELIVKDIMFSTDATITYQVAAGQAAIGGYSAFYVGTDYTHQRSFDLDICYGHFKDATRAYFDLGAETPNKTDGMHCGYITRMQREKFRELYGKDLEEKIQKVFSVTQSAEDIALAVQPDQSEDPFTWADNEGITILDHFVRKFQKDTLYKMSNGKSYNQEELDELIEKSQEMNDRVADERLQMELMQQAHPMDQYGTPMQMQQQPMMPNDAQTLPSSPNEAQGVPTMGDNGEMQAPGEEVELTEDEEEFPENRMTLWDDGQPVRIEDKRSFKSYKIWHYKIAGDYILEEGEFPADQLPVVFVDQNSYYDKSGKQVCRSFFGDCRDTQRYINYIRTQSAFVLKVSRYDQFIMSKKNAQGMDTQRMWRDPNAIQGALYYDEVPSGVKPEQLRPPELSASLTQQYEVAIQDLYLATGLYPTQLGQQGNEVSGSAIDARTRQGSYSTYCFFNAINRAITTGGSIINEMIPRVYDSERVITLMMPDEGMKNITVNKQIDEYGELIENDIRKGTYEVRLIAGPSYEGQKAEALQSLREVLQADPETFKLVADLYADNLPLSNNLEIKNRLKTIVPPEIIEAGKTGKMPQENGQPNPQQVAMQQQMQLQQQQMAIAEKEIQLKEEEIRLKQQKILMDAQVALQKLETEKLEVAGGIQEQELRYLAETQRTQSDESISHADNLVRILTHKIG